jgi:transcriptional regulator with XRE-family HTH domain
MGELILGTIVISVNDKALGIQLKKARLESGLSQEEVAAQLGVTWEMVSRYENGRSSPLKHIRKFAEIYSKPVTYFVANEAEQAESFDLNQLVRKLREEGIGYNKSMRNVIKVLESFSGRGIEIDLNNSSNYYEVSISLTDSYPNLFALRLEKLKVATDVALTKDDICFFAPGVEPDKGDVVIGYDGISYKVMIFDPEGLDTALAVLVASERRYKEK